MDDQRLSGDGSIREMGIQEAICVPIRGRNQLSGLIYIDALSPTGRSERDRFNKDHLKLMIAIGLQVGFAIDHERDLSRLLEQQQLATIGQTTSSLSHHMKNVLQGVNGGAHLVETGLKNRDMDLVEKGWEIVNRNQQEISKLVNDMLIFGQPYNPRRVNADLSAVIADVFEEIGPFLSRRNIKFDWSCETDEFLFRFDARGIYWALYNLINSCASTCHGITNGTIKVSVERGDDNAVVISIGDNGFVAKVSNPDDLFSPARS
jgi:nitrogen fixation/metabolism regulation signal transduction histidine kinase